MVLNGAEIQSREQLHTLLQQELQLPDWYGGNLDALHDCLTERSQWTEIRLIKTSLLTENLGKYGEALLQVLKASAQENEQLHILWE